jgi:hypothetical protein
VAAVPVGGYIDCKDNFSHGPPDMR